MKYKKQKMNTYLKSLFTMLFVVSIFQTNAQQTKVLSLEEALELANKNNLQLKEDSLQIEQLKTRATLISKSILPDVDINLGYKRISDNITPFKVAFPTGEVTLNPQILNQSYNSLQVTQLIWSGGKLKLANEISKKEVEAAVFDLTKNKLNSGYNVTTLWYNLYVLKTSKKVIEANIITLRGSQKDVNNFVKQGLVLQNEVLKIDLAITNFESNLIEITNSINSINYNIALLIRLPTNTVFELPEITENKRSIENNIENYITTALANRVELKAVLKYEEIARLGLKLTKLNAMPTISAIVSGNVNLPEQRQFPNKNTFTPTWYAGVNLNWSLASFYKNPIKVKESKLVIEKAKILFKQVEQGIMLEVNNAYTEYLQATQKIIVLNKAIELSTENFRVEQNKLKASIITATDFLDANTKQLQAKLNLNAAIANAQLALIKLNKTTNK
jgi:outer membrane protein